MVVESDYQYMNNKNPKIVSIIPARAGSKRIPGKNKMLFQGQSLIEWSVKFSLKCEYFSETILSTDDEEIKLFCKQYDIALHPRSKDLSKDTSSTFDLIKDIYFNYLNQKVDIIFLLQPTSPLREKNMISDALKLIKENDNWKSLVEVFQSISFPGKIKNGYWEPGLPEKTRSQEIEPNYMPSGRLYAYNCKRTVEIDDALGSRVLPMMTEEWKNVNIDEEHDLIKLEYVFNALKDEFSYLVEK